MNRSFDAVTRWLFVVCGLVMLMVVVGGYVRLARAGLAIVEWNVITGVIPPLSEEAWQQEFAKYQQSPEYQHVNAGMTLAEYKRIYFIEYFHRLLARIAGLAVLVPFLYFVGRGRIARQHAKVYTAIVVLFGLQGTVGWLMVKSGLIDRPSVSHMRLTVHLLLALFILALTMWTALNRHYYAHEVVPVHVRPGPARIALGLLGVLVVQIAYGGFVAGLKAGHVSNTWPLMFGYLIPPKLLSVVQPWWLNLVEAPLTVHFIHRWFAFVVAAFVIWLNMAVRRSKTSEEIRRGALLDLGLVSVQILLGIVVVVWNVPLPLALTHQAVALLLFTLTVFLVHRLVHPEPALAVQPEYTPRKANAPQALP